MYGGGCGCVMWWVCVRLVWRVWVCDVVGMCLRLVCMVEGVGV